MALKFSVDSHLVGELGERLVAKNYVALSELIKNAYDADATEVRLTFLRPDSPERAEIHVEDNGYGMTFKDVEQFWMRVATPNKIREPVSPKFGRRKTGNKGVGRFACQRLSRKVDVVSTAKADGGLFQETHLEIDWDAFEDGLDIDKVPCVASQRKGSSASRGVRLRLTRLRDHWTKTDFETLRRQLVSLIAERGAKRKGFDPDPGFDVVIKAPDFTPAETGLGEQLYDAGWGRLRARIDQKGEATLELSAKRVGKVRYALPDCLEHIRGVRIDLAFIPYNKERWRNPALLSKAGASQVLGESSGVKAYLDGFRVYPYGDPSDDWLHIDAMVASRYTAVPDRLRGLADRISGIDPGRAMLNHPKNENLLGGVYIDSVSNPGLAIKLSREGFVESEPYKELVSTVQLAIDWMTLYYERYLYLDSTDQVREAHEKLRRSRRRKRDEKSPLVEEPAAAAVEVLQDSIKTLDPESSSPATLRTVRSRVQAATEVVERYVDQTRSETNALRIMASSGALVFSFVHDVRDLTGRLEVLAFRIEDLKKGANAQQKKELDSFASDLRETRDRLNNQVSLFGLLAKGARENKVESVAVREAVEQILAGFSNLLGHYGIKHSAASIQPGLTAPRMLKGEFYSLVVNLLSNAVKAVIAGNGENVEVHASKEHEGFTLEVLDDGIGVPDGMVGGTLENIGIDPEGTLYKGLRKRVADADLAIVGEGSGLGLLIVQSILSNYGGTMSFVRPPPGWRTCAHVVVPYR